MKILFSGTIFGETGYDNHCRGLVNALYKINPEIRLDIPLNGNWQIKANDAENKMIQSTEENFDVHICINLPTMWNVIKNSWNAKKFYGFCVWEGYKIPNYWAKLLDIADGILVPSMHTKSAIFETIANVDCELKKDTKKIHLIHHGINPEIFYPAETAKDKRPFTFIANKGWRGGWLDRGGIGYLIKAFGEEFNDQEAVKLKIKINSTYAPNMDFEKEVLGLKIENKNPSRLEITKDQVSLDEIRDELYCRGDVFVCTQLADGFNLGGLEAMGCGLPTLQSDFGGQSDYVTEDNGWLLKKEEMFEVTHDVMYEGIKWRKPDIDEIRKALRYCFENQEDVRRKGIQALEDTKQWTWDISAQKLMKVLNDEK